MYKNKFLPVLFMILCLLNACNTFKASFNEKEKEIKAVVEEVPNYLFHLMTLGGIVPEDSGYILLYNNSISAKDQKYLNEHRNLLAWGDGNTGPLTIAFFFIPGYINFQSQSYFNEYIDSLTNVLKNNDFNIFTGKYSTYIAKMELLFGSIDMNGYLQSLIPYSNVVYEIGEIYKNNFQAYHLNVWPNEKRKIEIVANSLNIELKKHDLIRRWEDLIGKKFKTADYQIVLFSANKNGPNANSLGYERNTFYYGQDIDFMIQFISHEVGTHLLIEYLHQIAQGNQFEFSDVYSAYENLAEFYNVELILKGKPLIGYDVEKYYGIF
jgi:hypothetical protein